MSNPGLMTVALMLIPYAAHAQSTVDAGTQIQQIPPVPLPEKSVPQFRVEQRAIPRDDGVPGVSIRVTSLNITGQTIFSQAQLLAVTSFRSGGDFTLSQLRQFAAQISAYYNDRGYFLAQAYLPAQDIRGGAVTIAVIEGRYGKTVAFQAANQLTERHARPNDAVCLPNSPLPQSWFR